jgi:hypothetical protein
MSVGDPGGMSRPRRPLFYKYFVALFVAVVVPLLVNGASEAWFGYRDQRATLSSRLHAEAISAATATRYPPFTWFCRRGSGVRGQGAYRGACRSPQLVMNLPITPWVK